MGCVLLQQDRNCRQTCSIQNSHSMIIIRRVPHKRTYPFYLLNSATRMLAMLRKSRISRMTWMSRMSGRPVVERRVLATLPFKYLTVNLRPKQSAPTREKWSNSRIHGCWKMYVPGDWKCGEGFHTVRHSMDDSLNIRFTLFGIVSSPRRATIIFPLE